MTSCPLRVLLPNLGAHVVGVGNMGLLDHVFKPQALTKPSEWAYTVEVVCLDAQPWWPIKNYAPQVRMEGRRSANVTSYFGYHTFSYFHLGLRSDWVSIAVRLDMYISPYRGRVPTVCRDCGAVSGPAERLGGLWAFLT